MAVLEEPGATGPTRVSKAFQMRAPYVRETQQPSTNVQDPLVLVFQACNMWLQEM